MMAKIFSAYAQPWNATENLFLQQPPPILTETELIYPRENFEVIQKSAKKLAKCE